MLVDIRKGSDLKVLINSPSIIIRYITEGIAFSGRIDKNLYHFGGHGGFGAEEVFVPLLQFELDKELHETMLEDYKLFM